MNYTSTGSYLYVHTSTTNSNMSGQQQQHQQRRGAGREPTRDEMNAVFGMCRQNQWNSVLNCARNNPLIPVTSMIMDNHISTTIIHQAITSKGDTNARARVIREILENAPEAAAIRNGYGSLPLHVISQRNTKMDAQTKEDLINRLVIAYKGALLEEGGVGKRTPLHIIFTDYISPRLTKMMIEHGKGACFMKDKKGYLPAHVACSRHCSPTKLRMLLEANPAALTVKTYDGQSLLHLATTTATKSHPNYALIDELRRLLHEAGHGHTFEDHILARVISDEKNESPTRKETPKKRSRKRRTVTPEIHSVSTSNARTDEDAMQSRNIRPRRLHAVNPEFSDAINNNKVKNGANNSINDDDDDDDDPAKLLLHFSRFVSNGQTIKSFARV